MKLLAFISTLVFSLSAFSFTTVTLNKDVTLKSRNNGEAVYWSIEGNGSKYCYVNLVSKVSDKTIVPAGTVLEIVKVTDEDCEFNMVTRTCKASFTAQNRDEQLNLGVTCVGKGMFATPITPNKATKYSDGFMTVK